MLTSRLTAVKKIVMSTVLATLVTTSAAPSAHASLLSPEPLRAGDGFYTTSTATAQLPFMLNGTVPAAICTLTAITKQRQAISAAHCFDDIGQPLWTQFGRRIGTVIGLDRHHDIALIALNNNMPVVYTPMDLHGTRVGEHVTKVGTITQRTSGVVTHYVDSITSVSNEEHLMGLIQIEHRKAVHDVYLTNICAQQGDSGAPVFNRAGHVIGILSSSNAETTNCGDGTITAVVHLGSALASYKKTHHQ